MAEGRFGSWADSGVAALAKFTGTVRYKLQVHVDQPADDAPTLVDGGNVTVPTFRMYDVRGRWFAEGHGVDRTAACNGLGAFLSGIGGHSPHDPLARSEPD